MLRRPSLSLLTLSWVAFGCGTTQEDVGALRPVVEELSVSPSRVLVPLPDGRLVWEVEPDRLGLVDPDVPDAEPTIVGSALGVGEVRGVVPEGDAYLVLTSGGSFVLRGDSWVPSPFSDSLDGPVLATAYRADASNADASELWILTAQSLYRVVAGVAERVIVDDMSGANLEGAEIALARRPEGPSLWLLLSDRVVELWRDGSGALRSARLVLDTLPDAIAGDARGDVWLSIEGRLHSFGSDRRLVDRGVSATSFRGHANSTELWVFSEEEDEQIFVVSEGRLYRVESNRPEANALGVVMPDGSLITASPVVERFAPRRRIEVEAPRDGSLFGTSRTVRVTAVGEPEIEVRVDDQRLEGADGVFELSVDELGDGLHELSIRVTYDDGTLPTASSRTFEVVGNATWSEHVEPIYAEHCAACHGPDGSAVTRLDVPERWEGSDESYAILTNVSDGRMPLGRPPLSSRDVALIEAWMEQGFAR